MIRLGLIITTLLISFQSQASRLVEVEDYYSKKATEFIKMRYPNRPFTVYVKADAGENEIKARGAINEREVLNLPYLDVVNAKEGEFWSRTDLSLGTLISYLKSVYVKVDIDVNFDTNEREAFQEQLFKFLKLSPVYDRIEVSKMKWTTIKEVRDQRLWIGGVLLAPLVLFIMFFILSKISVKSLVRGLSEPLSEIGKSTENFANQAATMGQGQKSAISTLSSPLTDGGRKVALEILENNRSFFKTPDGFTIDFLENWGHKSPQAMGAIFNELDPSDVKELFRWGVGDWWYLALTHPGSLDNTALSLLNHVHSLRMRKNLGGQADLQLAERKELALALSRLEVKELGQILEGKNFEEVKSVLSLVPRERMINACKYLFPGEWASLIDKNESTDVKITKEMSDELYSKAINMKPLRGDEEVNQFFLEADLVKYLDQASTKDEREVYRMLPETSRAQRERFPFYKVFESGDGVIKRLATDISLEDWAKAFQDCERVESQKVFQFFTDRQKFLVRSILEQMKVNPVSLEEKVAAKEMISTLCEAYTAPQVVEEAEHEQAA